MYLRAALLVGLVASSMALAGNIPRPLRTTSAQSTACNTGLAHRDTARFTGIMVPRGYWFRSDPHPGGSARMWSDSEGRLHYTESFLEDNVPVVLSGEVEVGDDGLHV